MPVCFRRHGVRVGAPRRCQWLLHEPGNPPLDDSADGKGRRDTEWRAGPRSHPPPRQNHLVPRWTCSGTHAGVSYGRDHRRRWCNTAINVRLLLVSVVRKGCVVAYTLLCSLSRAWEARRRVAYTTRKMAHALVSSSIANLPQGTLPAVVGFFEGS